MALWPKLGHWNTGSRSRSSWGSSSSFSWGVSKHYPLTFPGYCCPDARPSVTISILSAWQWSWHRGQQSQLCHRLMESQPLDLYHLKVGSTSDPPVKRVNQLPCYWGKIKLGFLWLTVICKVKWPHGGNKCLAGAEPLVLFPALPPIGCVTISKSLHLSETHLPHLKRWGCWTRSVVLSP